MAKLNNPAPEGYSTISPYLIVDSVEEELKFLKSGLGAVILETIKLPDGSLRHGEAKIGNVVIMLGKSKEEYPATQTMLYTYVENVDETYQLALKEGGTSISEPKNEFYGDRTAGVTSPQGNQFWLAQHLEDVSKEEVEKRFAEMES